MCGEPWQIGAEPMTTAHEVNHEVADLGRQLRAAIPEAYAGYVQMSSGAGSSGYGEPVGAVAEAGAVRW